LHKQKNDGEKSVVAKHFPGKKFKFGTGVVAQW
jgi:hypothetical protein